MTFLPLGVLVLLDVFLITAILMAKIKERFFKNDRVRTLKIGTMTNPLAGNIRNRQYGEVEEMYLRMQNGFQMEETRDATMHPRQYGTTRFVELGAMQTEFSRDDGFNQIHEDDRTGLYLFVKSLSKCLGNSNFGLSFEFKDLGFQPKKSPKPTLSGVSGRINAGSLWGVMGPSGAGKCEFLILFR